MAAVAASLLLGLAAGVPAHGAPEHNSVQAKVTWYAARDNDPPGSTEIAYPRVHRSAGGIGTHDDPITFAADPKEFAPGTLVYYPAFKKYFVMEDLCGECRKDWRNHHRTHIDLWAGAATDRGVIACENRLTSDSPQGIIVDPEPGFEVDTRPVYDAGTGTCIR
jgi:3D (Asp-Asp-Asp) domain-containing protein